MEDLEKNQLDDYGNSVVNEEDDTSFDEGNENPENESSEGGEPEKTENQEEVEKQKAEEEKAKKEKQTREQNAYFAKQRKEREQREKENEAIKKQGFIEGLKQAYNGVNKFTNEPLADAHDVEIFSKQLELERQGLDPINDLAKFIANEKREEAKKQESAIEKEKRINDDISSFKKLNPNVNLKELLSNDDFAKFANERGIESLDKTYKDYLNYKSEIEETIEKEVQKRLQERVAKTQSSPSLNNTPIENEDTGLSIEDVKKYTQKELIDMMHNDPKKYERVLKSYNNYQKQK